MKEMAAAQAYQRGRKILYLIFQSDAPRAKYWNPGHVPFEQQHCSGKCGSLMQGQNTFFRG
jgi:hypothetical protein